MLATRPALGSPPAASSEPASKQPASKQPASKARRAVESAARNSKRTAAAVVEVLGEDGALDHRAGQQSSRHRLVWRPTSVAWPLAPLTRPATEASPLAAVDELPARLQQRQAMRDGEMAAPSLRGPVALDGEQAVNVWLGALETVRVQQLDGEASLRFVRIVDDAAVVVEPGRVVEPGPLGERRYELTQPPADGAIWSIEADGPTRVLIERAEPRSPRYAAVEVEHDLLRWIEDDAGLDRMPAVLEPADELIADLRLQAELGRELLALAEGDPKLQEAVTAWRQLAAMQGLDRMRLAVRPYFVRDRDRSRPLPLEDTEAKQLATEDTRDYRLARLEPGARRRWTLDRKGPGQLRVSARAWSADGETLHDAELRILADGRVIARLPLSRRAARHGVDPDTAFPRFEPLLADDGHPVGEFAGLIVALAPGRQRYELELVGGPAMISLEGAQRIDASLASARGWTPRKRAKAARRLTRRSERDERIWLEALLAEQDHGPTVIAADDPRLEALGERSPALALCVLAQHAEVPELSSKQLWALGRRAEQWLAELAADADFDPRARGRLRARWLAIAALHHDRRLARTLIDAGLDAGPDPIHELPLMGLLVLAEQLISSKDTVRSSALALLELARRRAPEDEQVRGRLLYVWNEFTHWSRRRPVAETDFALQPAGEWLMPREIANLDPGDRGPTWLRLLPGQPAKVEAELSSGLLTRDLETEAVRDPRRMRLLDVHVSTPVASAEPVRLRVDQQAWWSPQLRGVVRHRVAVAAGVHEVELTAPAGTVAWAELPAAEDLARYDPALLGRKEQMWPLDQVRWRLPGPPVPGYARLELRWLGDREPGPVRITAHQDGDLGAEVTLLFDPRTGDGGFEVDGEATPLGPSPVAGVRHDVIVPIDAQTKWVWFEVSGSTPVAAALSLRRAVYPNELDPAQEVMVRPEEIAGEPLLAEVFAELTALDGEALMLELSRLSRLLLLTPEDLDARARRAALLLMLGETGFARADLVQLSAWGEREGVSARKRERAEQLLAELEDSFDSLIEPREIIVADANHAREPFLIEPAIAAVVGDDRQVLEPWLKLWSAGRDENLDEALARLDAAVARDRRRLEQAGEDGDQVAAMLPALTRATWLSAEIEQGVGAEATHAREASRLWLRLYGMSWGGLGQARDPVAVGLAAVMPLLAHLDDPSSDARDAGLAFGLARELEPRYSHTAVRRLAFIAALRSDWSRLDHAEDAGGFERLELPVVDVEPTPEAAVREAMLVAPWADDEAREVLGPGRKGVLAWDAVAGSIEAEIWCRAGRPDLSPSRADLVTDPGALGGAELVLRLRGGPDNAEVAREHVAVGDAALARVRLPVAAAGRHQLEIVLGDDPIWTCAWRGRALPGQGAETSTSTVTSKSTSAITLEPRRRARWWTAEVERPVEFVILGPASLNLEARAISAGEAVGAAALEVWAAPIGEHPGPSPGLTPKTATGSLALAPGVEASVITETRRRFAVTEAVGHTLLLTEPGPYRVQIRTDRGRALVRARVRRDRDDLPPPARVSLRELRGPANEPESVLDWRGIGPAVAIDAGEPDPPIDNRIGTLDARVRAGLDDIGELDDLRPRLGLDASVGWRRALREDRLWLLIAAQVHLRDATAAAGGGRLHLGGRIPVVGMRAGLQLEALASRYGPRPAGSVRVEGFLDRPVWLSPHLQLRPGLDLGYRWQSLNPGQLAGGGGGLDVHPRIYQQYVEEHPFVFRPQLELRVYPFQDMALSTEVSMVPNSNFVGVDHVDLDAGFQGIGRMPRPWVPSWGLGYQASLRFADANRSNSFVRHSVDASLGLAVWARDAVRVAFGLGDRLYLSPGQSGSPVRNTFQLWLRLDGAFGRRMRDYGPREQWFREPWAPRAWGDSERQAGSTTTRGRRGRGGVGGGRASGAGGWRDAGDGLGD